MREPFRRGWRLQVHELISGLDLHKEAGSKQLLLEEAQTRAAPARAYSRNMRLLSVMLLTFIRTNYKLQEQG